MGRRYKYSDQYVCYECEWYRVKGTWLSRPCPLRVSYPFGRMRRPRREYCDSSICTNTEVSVVDSDKLMGKVEEKTPVEAEDKTNTETGTAKGGVSSSSPAGSKPTPSPQHHHEVDAKKSHGSHQRQAKSYIGPRAMIDEGINLAFDSDGDVARIRALNRKAWSRGQEPIAADATAEDREIAELVRRGLVGAEALQVDHGNDFGGDGACLYTIRFAEGRKKGMTGKRQGGQAAEPVPPNAEADWWYLDDEAYAQLLSDGETELVDWSEASSFVHVDY